MDHSPAINWLALALLGAFHGINPGMGWLFAVALGLQQRAERGVWKALPPIALGHAAAIAVVLSLAALVGLVLPFSVLKISIAAILVSLGLYRLWRHRHPRFGGMQVGFRDLTIWSFLMASAHGAGLMLLPFVLPLSRSAHGENGHLSHALPQWNGPLHTAGALGIHTLAYFVVMSLVAWLVYRWFGLAILRSAWFNLDLLWAIALVLTGLLVLLL